MKRFQFFGLLLLSTALLFNSCEQEHVEFYDFVFTPRACKFIKVEPASIQDANPTGDSIAEFIIEKQNASIKAQDFSLRISTMNFNIDSIQKFNVADYKQLLNNTDKRMKGLEEIIYNNYILASRTNKNIPLDVKSIIFIEYRITGVKSFNIKSLDATLFDEAQGSSLNAYFKIKKFAPDFIASFKSSNVEYGFDNSNKPSDIDTWLSLLPLANESMYLTISRKPDRLPLTTRFLVEMETVDGNKISYTTGKVTLTE